MRVPLFFLLMRPPPRSPLFPYTTLFRSVLSIRSRTKSRYWSCAVERSSSNTARSHRQSRLGEADRSEEHTSELQSRLHLVCRLLLEKKKHPHDNLARHHICLAPQCEPAP